MLARTHSSALAAFALAAWALAAGTSSAQTVSDPNLTVTQLLPNFALAWPTSMAFVAPGDILVLEKDTGRVRRVLNGVLQATIALDVAVNFESERGLLGIAVNTETPRKVFLYYTEAASDGGAPLGNRVVRYTWNPGSGLLTSPQLILDLPVLPGSNHNGGILRIGRPSDGGSVGDGSFLSVVIGDVNRNGKLQNNPAGANPDDSSVILRVQQDGSPAPGNPFTGFCSLATATACDEDSDCAASGPCLRSVERYFAYGVRNCFGMAFDPVTEALWITENGPNQYDEINRVAPGMNSGWNRITGPDARDPEGVGDLYDIPGSGSTYSDPEFSWLTPIGVTGIVFPYGSNLGIKYNQSVLVADANFGALYALPLKLTRTALSLSGFMGVSDLVADSTAERDQFRIGSGFIIPTDLQIGPDGDLYVLSYYPGTIYRISGPGSAIPVPGLAPLAASLLALLLAAFAILTFARRDAGAMR